jgi:hypothetical protein
MDKLGSDEMMMDSDEMMGDGHGMMNDHEMMMNDRRMGKARAEDGDTVEPLRRVLQPEVRFFKRHFILNDFELTLYLLSMYYILL